MYFIYHLVKNALKIISLAAKDLNNPIRKNGTRLFIILNTLEINNS